MGRFGIGARVLDRDGDKGTIVAKPSKGNRLIKYEGNIGDRAWLNGETIRWPKSDLTLLPDNDNSVGKADQWVPKVGDRVRVVDNSTRSGLTIGKYVVGEEYEVTGICKDSDGNDAVLLLNHNQYLRPGQFEPVVAPATTAATPGLTIEAGKFYRTRDGRKVGPAVASLFGQPWRMRDEAGGADRGFNNDGSWMDATDPSRHDLVAEWVEPAPEPVAVAEATATLKVGDRVRPVSDKLGWVTSHWAAYWKDKEGASEDDTFLVTLIAGWGDVKISAKLGGDGPYWSATDFELVEPSTPEPSTPPAKFKVGDRVRHTELGYEGEVVSVLDHEFVKTYWPSEGWGATDPITALEQIAPAPAIGSTVTFTATGRLSAINENGHMQVTFPGLTPGQNSFALPAQYVTLAN